MTTHTGSRHKISDFIRVRRNSFAITRKKLAPEGEETIFNASVSMSAGNAVSEDARFISVPISLQRNCVRLSLSGRYPIDSGASRCTVAGGRLLRM